MEPPFLKRIRKIGNIESVWRFREASITFRLIVAGRSLLSSIDMAKTCSSRSFFLHASDRSTNPSDDGEQLCRSAVKASAPVANKMLVRKLEVVSLQQSVACCGWH